MHTKSWHCLQLEVPQALADGVAALCFERGSCGLEINEQGECSGLRIYFPAQCDVDEVRSIVDEFLIKNEFSAAAIENFQVEQADWEVEWRRFFRPIWATPRMVVHPSWIPVEIEEGIAIVIDPKMAFGTGGHESTQLCLQALERYIRPNCRCLDVGTGSGILSIAAAKLGAASVLALDIDPLAIENAGENVERNGIGIGIIDLHIGSVGSAAGEFDLIFANIQSHILVPMLAHLYELMVGGAVALFSGVLDKECEDFIQQVERAGLEIEEVLAENEWVCAVAKRTH